MCRVLVVYTVCVEARVGAGACECTCVWRSEVTLGCGSTGDIRPTIHLGFLFWFFEARSLTSEDLPIRLGCLAGKLQRSICLCLLSLQLQLCHYLQLFNIIIQCLRRPPTAL